MTSDTYAARNPAVHDELRLVDLEALRFHPGLLWSNHLLLRLQGTPITNAFAGPEEMYVLRSRPAEFVHEA